MKKTEKPADWGLLKNVTCFPDGCEISALFLTENISLGIGRHKIKSSTSNRLLF
ncbi:MAG: hypothetical protein K2W79_11805 [Hydrotalea flava]|uniref:hypothetical protein n=1 Tax=Hydrotalea TaxID=1004300 RepID=UPI001C48CECB|nr:MULTISPECIES: hypothetical protein [Hydrotalea]MBY0348935.1 hypothetical protein [Hydrotalea flava]